MDNSPDADDASAAIDLLTRVVAIAVLVAANAVMGAAAFEAWRD